MAATDLGWSDIGGWGALLEALGADGPTDARLVLPGEAATLTEVDLAVVSDGQGLAIHVGPSTIRSDGPVALLTGASADRDRVAQLLDRCARMEAQQA